MRSRHIGAADFVVVGAGSAGSIVASELAAAGASVIVVEAGGTDRRPDVYVPFGLVSLYANANWRYPTAPDPSTGGEAGAFAAGKIVGGSGSINAMVFNRGRADDFDSWAAAGAPGWSYVDVLPSFQALETWVGGGDEFRGDTGPLAVNWCGHNHPLDAAFIEAAVEAGFPRNADQNGRHQLGVARCQVNQSRGLRYSSARAYLKRPPKWQRPRVLTGVSASRVVVESGRAVAVECRRQTIRARQGVILCAGAVGTPALLLRSGIGPRGEVLELPGVGENFHDHLVAAQHWESRVPTLNTMGIVSSARALGNLAVHGTGALTTTPFEAQLFTDDYQIAISPVRYDLDPVRGRASLRRRDAFTVYTVLLHPEVRGRVTLRGDRPIIDMPRLGNSRDVRKLLEGVELTRDIIESSSAMRELVGENLDGLGTRDVDWLAVNESSIYHAVGTCRMGTDADAVVDPQLRVHGVDGLHVIDASVMPAITAGNTNAPTMMAALRGAEFVLHA